MLKKYILPILLLLIQLHTEAQKTLVLSSPQTGQVNNFASDHVQFKPGYSFKATINDWMKGYLKFSLVTEPDYKNDVINENISERVLNTSKMIGSIDGAASTSPLGAANYSINIDIPKGINNLIPNVSINYSSQAGNGILGLGWNLNAISSIVRTHKNFYHDNDITTVKYTNNDVFMLDGQRLFANGLNGLDGTGYYTEVLSFNKITSKGNINGGPEYFIVELKNGNKIYYGLTSNSRVNGNNTSVPMQWNIEKVEDVNGNFYLYKYIWENNQLRLDEISYTGNSNTNTQTFASIKFRYQERVDKQTIYFNDKLLENNLLLKEIVVFNKNAIFKKYQFRYKFNMYSYLSEIEELTDNNLSLNSTLFQYGDNEVTNSEYASLVYSTNNDPSGTDYVPGDYNGDGVTDLIRLFFTRSNNVKVYNSFNLMLNSKQDVLNFSNRSTITIPPGFNIEETNNFVAFSSLGNFLGGDFNGDGKKDFILTNKTVSTDGSKINTIRVYTSTGEGFSFVDYDFRNYSHNRFFYKAPYFVHLGDFDGDGLTDIGLILSNGISYSFIVIQKGQIKNYGQLAVNPSLIDNIYVTDFNGNGKDELFIVQSFNDINRRAQIIEVNKINGQDMLETIYGSGYPTHWHKLLRVGDFNGDGKTDILHYNSPNSWTVGYFNGNGFSTKNIPSVNISLSAELTDQSLRVMDVNGDGKSDITYFTGSKKVIWYSTGDQFIETLDDSPWNGNRTDYLMVGDFDGDGKLDEICPVYFGDINRFKIYYRHKNNHSFLLKKVADGFNNITEFDYAPYDARDNNFMFNNYNFTTSKFNIMSFNVPTTVVKKVKTTNPNGGINELEFLYRTMFFSRAKGMLGFNQVFTYNPKTNTTSCTESEPFENNDFPLVFPKINYVYRSRVFGHSNSAVLSSEKPTLQLQKINNNQYWIKNIGSHSYNSLNRLNTYNQLQYDEFGNVVNAKTTLGTGPNSVISEVTNTYTQKNTFIPAHIETTEKKLTRNGQTPVIKKQAFEYDALGRLVKETVHPNHALQSQTQFVYDNFGNVTQTILTASNLPTQVSKLVYDDLGRNIIKKINEQNQESNYTFTHLYDLPETITNIYGEKTEFEYDAFGNLIKTKMPNGDEMETITEWAISQGDNSSWQNQSTLYKITNKTTNQPTSISWYNRAGLEVKSTTEGLSNTFIKSMAYDDLGRVIQATEPFYQGETPIVISTVYDDLGRVISQGTPSQKQLFAYSYTPETSIVSTTFPDGTIKKTTTDASGLTIKAEDNGGALVYTYYSDGNLKSVSLNGTEMVSLEYDINGNKTKTVDKNAGTYTYQYNAYGLIKQQTNPNNQTNTYNYDNFNRLINAQTPEGAIVYTYINEGKGLNQVKTINYPKYALTYEYGNFNQISKITEVIDDQTLVYNYQYDNKGNKTTLTYPSGFKIKYNYTDKGFLNKITSDLQPNITLWEAQEQNSMGVTNKYLSGNGVQTVKTFDEFKLPKTIKAGNIMDVELDFNPENANLRSRKDKLRNLTEVFTYDNLDRLTQSKVNNYTPITINYAPNGNITQKSDVGAYVYDATKVNAVKEVSSNNLDVLAQQNITYSSFQSPTLIKEGDYQLELLYSHDRSRKKTTLKQNNQTKQTTYFSGGYEKQVDAQNNTTELHYLNNINTIVVKQNNQYKYYFTYKDHLGTIVAITDINGNVVEEFNYDAWGLKRNPDNWTYELDTTPSTLTWFKRGYTGHEHLDEFGLINMNSRLYDPQIGRMLSPDNYIQSVGYSQNYNRYSYVWNNPMKFTDPSGDFVITAMIIGAGIGMWQGGALANNGEINPIKWDYNSAKTWGYMAGGAIVGAASSYIGATIAASGMPMANTVGIAMSSYVNSVGTNIYTGGQTDVSISFGFGSYNLSQNKLRGIWNWGELSTGEKIGYGLGAMANLADVLAGVNPGDVSLRTENDPNFSKRQAVIDEKGNIIGYENVARKDLIGHSQIVDMKGKPLIDWGPNEGVGFKDWVQGTNSYEGGVSISASKMKWDPITIKGVNVNRISNWNPSGKYNLALNSCVSQTSRALNASGVFNIGIHPYILHGQMYLRSLGVRPMMYSYYLN